MPKDLTIFALAKSDGQEACLAYALIRDVRGRGDYPAPVLPTGFDPAAPVHQAIDGHPDIELIGWTTLLDQPHADAVLKGLSEGRFAVPEQSPIESGKTLSGGCCEVTILEEPDNHWTHTCGTGLLLCRSLVIDKALDGLTAQLEKWVGPGRMPDALAKIVSLIARSSGLKNVFLRGTKVRHPRSPLPIGRRSAFLRAACARRSPEAPISVNAIR